MNRSSPSRLVLRIFPRIFFLLVLLLSFPLPFDFSFPSEFWVADWVMLWSTLIVSPRRISTKCSFRWVMARQRAVSIGESLDLRKINPVGFFPKKKKTADVGVFFRPKKIGTCGVFLLTWHITKLESKRRGFQWLPCEAQCGPVHLFVLHLIPPGPKWIKFRNGHLKKI